VVVEVVVDHRAWERCCARYDVTPGPLQRYVDGAA
jgi:hypothetical protein